MYKVIEIHGQDGFSSWASEFIGALVERVEEAREYIPGFTSGRLFFLNPKENWLPSLFFYAIKLEPVEPIACP